MSDIAAPIKKHFDRLRPQVVRPAEGFLKYDYLVPGGYYVELWDWDGFFIGVHMASRGPREAEHLKNWAFNFVAAADERGYAPGCVTPAGPEPGHRSFQMKPFIAQGAAIASRAMGETAWLADCYDDIRRIATLREETHFDARYGLFYWDNAMQSGADDNPALSNEEDELRAFLACDINAFQLREYMALAWIAGEIGRHDDQREFGGKARNIEKSMVEHLWNAGDASFWNVRRDSGEQVKRVSYSNFVPLIQPIIPVEDGREMIRRYLWNSDHMRGPFGLRTLSKRNPDYSNENRIWPYSNWRGPVWPIANYLYFRGLMNYGCRAEAEDLARTIGGLCLKDIESCGAMHENYDADTGAPLAPSSGDQSPKGFHEGGFIGWNLLVQNMQEELESGEDSLRVTSDE